MKPTLSIVIPVFNEDESLVELFDWIISVVDKANISTEVIFIDDGSDDQSWSVIKSLAVKDSRAIGIKFTRNNGKSAALQTGFDASRGEVVITMDADLQDSPDEIPELVKMIQEEGYHLVSGWKKKRHDPLEKRIPSKFFNWVTRKVSGIHIHDFNCGLKAYKSDVVKNIKVYAEMHRYIPVLSKWAGFKKIGEKVVQHQARKYGVTKFGMKRYITGFLDLLSVIFVTRFRKSPMHFFGALGTISFVFGMFVSCYLIFNKLYRLYMHIPARDVVDQPLFFISLVAVIVGVQLFLAGFIAEMIIQVDPKKNDYLILERTDA